MRKIPTCGVPVCALLAGALLLAGCGSDSRGTGDAPAGQIEKKTITVIPMPNGFGNVAVTCWKGNGIYTGTHGKTDFSPTVIPADPACKSAPQ